MEQNVDEYILINQRIDQSFDGPLVHQVLRIAIYDEFHAYEIYSRVIEKFGPIPPFVNIVEAENRHYNLLLPLFEKYGVEVPINNWQKRINIPNSFVECCEIGVATEIDNIAMYDHLLQYSIEADIKDALFQLQAAAYNNHLPAFRQCINQHYNALNDNMGSDTDQNNTAQNADTGFGPHNPEELFAKAEEYQSLFQSLLNGNIDQQELSKLIQNSNLALIGGLLAGGLGTMLFNNLKTDSENTSDSETD